MFTPALLTWNERTASVSAVEEILAFKAVTLITCPAAAEEDNAESYPTSAHVADADVKAAAAKVNLPVNAAEVASFTE